MMLAQFESAWMSLDSFWVQSKPNPNPFKLIQTHSNSIQTDPNSPKLTQNGSKLIQTGSNWAKLIQDGPKLIQTHAKRRVGLVWAGFGRAGLLPGSALSGLDPFGWFSALLGRFWRAWGVWVGNPNPVRGTGFTIVYRVLQCPRQGVQRPSFCFFPFFFCGPRASFFFLNPAGIARLGVIVLSWPLAARL